MNNQTSSRTLFSKNAVPTISVVVALLVFVIYKLRFLALGYFWDEAWPYAVAIRTMHAGGLSLLPGAIPPELARGHPLMFHFMAAGWMKIFGTSLVAGHAFALTVTVITATITYLFCRKLLSAPVGAIAAILLLCQPTVIFQAVFLLPEMTVAMWTMASLYFYLTEKKLPFVLCATALILTKEPGVVLAGSLLLCEAIGFVADKQREIKTTLRRMGLIGLPILIASSFFIIQRITAGWFFLPLYTDVLKSPLAILAEQLPSAAAYVFIYQGRNGMVLLVIAALAFIASRKINVPEQHKRIILFLFAFVCCFLLFSAGNYYMPRYLACPFPPLMIVCVYLLHTAFARMPAILALMVAGLMGTFIYYYVTEPASGDCDYSPAINVATRMVAYCEHNIPKEKHVYTTCVLRYNLGDPYVGYLHSTAFTHLQTEITGDTEYCIFWGAEGGTDELARAQQKLKLQLLFKTTDGNQWCEVYKVLR